MYVESRQFSHPRVFNAPMKGFPVEFGIGVRGPKCLNDGPKKFSDRFSRFDTIPAVTDTQPATQPRRRSYYGQRLSQGVEPKNKATACKLFEPWSIQDRRAADKIVGCTLPVKVISNTHHLTQFSTNRQ